MVVIARLCIPGVSINESSTIPVKKAVVTIQVVLFLRATSTQKIYKNMGLSMKTISGGSQLIFVPT